MSIPEVYLRPGRRRPVRLIPVAAGFDLQQASPKGWCDGCGAELYSGQMPLCRRCRRDRKGEENDEQGKSM